MASTNGGSTNNSGSNSSIGYAPMYPSYAPTISQGWSSGNANLSYLQPYLPPLPAHSPSMTENTMSVAEAVHPRKRSRCEMEGSDSFNQVTAKDFTGSSGENSNGPPKKTIGDGSEGKADGAEEEVDEDEVTYSDDENTGEGSPL